MINGIISSQKNIKVIDYVPASMIATAGSVRSMRSSYTAFAFNVRRSSDNSITDLSYDLTGVVSTSSTVSAGGTFATWMGSDSIYIVTWYDQSGNGNNITNAILTGQPQLANAGVINTRNGRPTVYFNGLNTLDAPNSASLSLDTAFSFFSIIEFQNFITVRTLIDKRSAGGAFPGYHAYMDAATFGMQWNTTSIFGAAVSTALSTGVLYSVNLTATKISTANFYRGLTQAGATQNLNASGSSVNTVSLKIGGHVNNAALYLNGYISEWILLNAVATTSQHNPMINNQRNFFGVT